MTVYTAVSMPKPLVDEIARFVKDVGFWPSISAFVREACLEKLRMEREGRASTREAEI